MADPEGSAVQAADAEVLANPRERLVRTAYDLFRRHGIGAVGIDRVVAEAGVAKMTLYRHFSSKQALVLETLELREQLWTREWLEAEMARLADDPAGQLLAVFDAFDPWFRDDAYSGCMFINCLLEARSRRDPVGAASAAKLANVTEMLRGLAENAGAGDPQRLADSQQLLMRGSILAAAVGDRGAARRAKEVAEMLLAREGLTAPG
jgi:AcrR family transcriptional regulator